MKNILLPILLAVMPAVGFAANLADLQTKELAKISVSDYRIATEAHLVNIQYVGSSSQAVLSIATDALTTAVPIGTADLSIDMSAAAYDTLGELCDAIDADSDYTCELTGGKRDDDSSLLADVSGSASVGVLNVSGGYNVLGNANGYINRIGITPMSGKRVVLKYCEVQTDAVGTIKVYGKLKKFEVANDGIIRGDHTQVYSAGTLDDDDEVDGNIYGGNWLEFATDERVVISAGNASTAQTATSFLSCFWDEK